MQAAIARKTGHFTLPLFVTTELSQLIEFQTLPSGLYADIALVVNGSSGCQP